MKTTLLCSMLSLSGLMSYSQSFQQVSGHNIAAGFNSNMEFFDMDGDGDNDLIANYYASGQSHTTLYSNDGNGVFTPVTGPFVGVNYGDIEIGDLNGDGHTDIIVNGRETPSATVSTNIYLNDGSGNFTLKTGHNLPNIGYGGTELGDLDNDGDLDIVLAGATNSDYPFSYTDGIFVNDGSANFTQDTYGFIGSNAHGGLGLIDYNSDGLLDIVANEQGISQMMIHTNMGNLNFVATSVWSDYSFANDIKVADFNGDGNEDIVAFGLSGSEILQGNGTLNFTSTNTTLFDYSMNDCNIDVGDYDNDGDLDLIQIGWSGAMNTAKVMNHYVNDGSGVFTLNINSNFLGVRNGNVTSGDVDGNGTLEVLVIGSTSVATEGVYLYEQPNCNVTIPDANFKAYLVGNTAINTNGDTEIQCAEAAAFTGSIVCSNLNVSDLTGIEAFTSAIGLFFHNNSVSSLDISSNQSLAYLSGNNNQLSSIDLTNNTALQEIVLTGNQLTSIDVSQNTNVTNLEVTSNQITAINVAQLGALQRFYCHGNLLTTLDVSANSALVDLACSSNNLTSLNVANGNNTNFTHFQSSSNSNLFCIQVDDSTYSANNWTNIDSHSSFREHCNSTVGVIENGVSYDVYPNPTNGIIHLTSDVKLDRVELLDLTGKVLFSTTHLNLDLSPFAKGTYLLKAYHNQQFSVQKITKE